MTVLYLILLLLAAVCFAGAVANRRVNTGTSDLNLVALGLLFWVLVPLIQTIRTV